MELVPGIYEQPVDEALAELMRRYPDLRYVLHKIDDELSVELFADFVSELLKSALKSKKPADRLQLVNRLVELLSAQDGLDYLAGSRLLAPPEVLTSVIPACDPRENLPRTASPLSISTLLTGAAGDPSLDNELRLEMVTADRVDLLVSFIKWSGLRLLKQGFEDLQRRGVKVRIITTSYMGASDPKAVEWLASLDNTRVRISYDTKRTRLHAKAYLFYRESGFSTAYIGSSNISQPAMTSGLEWNLKITRRDLSWIVDRFSAEFESYWNSEEFEDWDEENPQRFSQAIRQYRNSDDQSRMMFFADIEPYPFQARILERLELERRERGHYRNLVIAATGTGKTVMAALDYRNVVVNAGKPGRLLFVAHRREILLQSRDCFRAVLRDVNFGELLTGTDNPDSYEHIFATVQSVNRCRLWEAVPADHFDYIVLDEAHHGTADSYRGLINKFNPGVLLGLTATPERMDGDSILPDFGGRFAAEIRLPEALEEKLLCPFHYFGVSDPVSLKDDRFWRRGRFVIDELENVYTGDDIRARQRLDAVINSLEKYLPDVDAMRAVGFCAGIRHARYMADAFRSRGFSAESLVSECREEDRARIVREFRGGELQILFTVDLLSEGFDLPEIDTVLFLRPTESLTVFLQQLGRGVRHAPGKECLTVLDFVGQTHRKYRIGRKFAALLPIRRYRIDREVELDFPHLPPGCSIILERQAREHVLGNINRALKNLSTYVTETIGDLEAELGREPTIAEFADISDVAMGDLLSKRSWSEWLALKRRSTPPNDPDLHLLRKGVANLALRDAPAQMDRIDALVQEQTPPDYLGQTDMLGLHLLLTRKHPLETGISGPEEFVRRVRANPSIVSDIRQLVGWRRALSTVPSRPSDLPFDCSLNLHGTYGSEEIKAALGLSGWSRKGARGVGVIHDKSRKLYVHLVTFRKNQRDFVPTTLYEDYPISPDLLHWESQSTLARHHETAKNYQEFKERGYTILFFARLTRKRGMLTEPFTFLGPAKALESSEGERPLRMVWRLVQPMPAELYEQARRGG